MPTSAQHYKASQFAALHRNGRVLVLPNAWDTGSAAVIAAAGARAIATTSGGVSWAVGRPDGEGLAREQMVEQVGRIARAVDLPVSADVEGGYGLRPADVAETVAATIAAGAVGVNIEDSTAPGGPLFTVAEQADRLAAAAEAAARAGLPALTINARTDLFLFGIGPEEERLAAVVERARAYAAAGATALFVPGLLDLDALAQVVRATALPVNALAGPGGPSIAQLGEAGVRRVSLGTWIAQAAYGAARRAAAEAFERGTCDTLDGALDYGALNALFPR